MGLRPININRDPYPFPKLEGDIQFRGEETRARRRTLKACTLKAQSKVSKRNDLLEGTTKI